MEDLRLTKKQQKQKHLRGNSIELWKIDENIKHHKKLAAKRSVISSLNERHSISESCMGLMCTTPCIYYLKANNNVVYVGETENLWNRISGHFRENVKVFDSLSFDPFIGSKKQRLEEEKRIIKKLNPHYNIVHKVKRDPIDLQLGIVKRAGNKAEIVKKKKAKTARRKIEDEEMMHVLYPKGRE